MIKQYIKLFVRAFFGRLRYDDLTASNRIRAYSFVSKVKDPLPTDLHLVYGINEKEDIAIVIPWINYASSDCFDSGPSEQNIVPFDKFEQQFYQVTNAAPNALNIFRMASKRECAILFDRLANVAFSKYPLLHWFDGEDGRTWMIVEQTGDLKNGTSGIVCIESLRDPQLYDKPVVSLISSSALHDRKLRVSRQEDLVDLMHSKMTTESAECISETLIDCLRESDGDWNRYVLRAKGMTRLHYENPSPEEKKEDVPKLVHK